MEDHAGQPENANHKGQHVLGHACAQGMLGLTVGVLRSFVLYKAKSKKKKKTLPSVWFPSDCPRGLPYPPRILGQLCSPVYLILARAVAALERASRLCHYHLVWGDGLGMVCLRQGRTSRAAETPVSLGQQCCSDVGRRAGDVQSKGPPSCQH